MPDDLTLNLPDLSSLSIDLTSFRYKDGDDDEFIEKANGKQDYLETWSTTYNAALLQYGAVILNYLQQAQNVPIEIREQFQQMQSDAENALTQMRTILASANLPELPSIPAGYMLRVNASGTGYEAVSPDALMDGSNSGSSLPDLENKIVGSSVVVAENSSGEKFYNLESPLAALANLAQNFNNFYLNEILTRVTVSGTTESPTIAEANKRYTLMKDSVLELPSNLVVKSTVHLYVGEDFGANYPVLIADKIKGDDSGSYSYDFEFGVTLVRVSEDYGWGLKL